MFQGIIFDANLTFRPIPCPAPFHPVPSFVRPAAAARKLRGQGLEAHARKRAWNYWKRADGLDKNLCVNAMVDLQGKLKLAISLLNANTPDFCPNCEIKTVPMLSGE